MAALTQVGSTTFTTASGTKTVVASPSIGDLIIIVIAHTGNVVTTPPTDDQVGGTYSLITSSLKASSADVLAIFIRNSLMATGVSTTFTHAPGGTSGGGMVVMKAVGMTRVGLMAARQSAIQSNQSGGGTPTPVFGVAALTGNPVIGALFNAASPAGMTARSSPAYTETTDVGYSTPTTGLEVMQIDSGETGTSIAWGSTCATAFCDIAVELNTSLTPAYYAFFEPERPTSKPQSRNLNGFQMRPIDMFIPNIVGALSDAAFGGHVRPSHRPATSKLNPTDGYAYVAAPTTGALLVDGVLPVPVPGPMSIIAIPGYVHLPAAAPTIIDHSMNAPASRVARTINRHAETAIFPYQNNWVPPLATDEPRRAPILRLYRRLSEDGFVASAPSPNRDFGWSATDQRQVPAPVRRLRSDQDTYVPPIVVTLADYGYTVTVPQKALRSIIRHDASFSHVYAAVSGLAPVALDVPIPPFRKTTALIRSSASLSFFSIEPWTPDYGWHVQAIEHRQRRMLETQRPFVDDPKPSVSTVVNYLVVDEMIPTPTVGPLQVVMIPGFVFIPPPMLPGTTPDYGWTPQPRAPWIRKNPALIQPGMVHHPPAVPVVFPIGLEMYSPRPAKPRPIVRYETLASSGSFFTIEPWTLDFEWMTDLRLPVCKKTTIGQRIQESYLPFTNNRPAFNEWTTPQPKFTKPGRVPEPFNFVQIAAQVAAPFTFWESVAVRHNAAKQPIRSTVGDFFNFPNVFQSYSDWSTPVRQSIRRPANPEPFNFAHIAAQAATPFSFWDAIAVRHAAAKPVQRPFIADFFVFANNIPPFNEWSDRIPFRSPRRPEPGRLFYDFINFVSGQGLSYIEWSSSVSTKPEQLIKHKRIEMPDQYVQTGGPAPTANWSSIDHRSVVRGVVPNVQRLDSGLYIPASTPALFAQEGMERRSVAPRRSPVPVDGWIQVPFASFFLAETPARPASRTTSSTIHRPDGWVFAPTAVFFMCEPSPVAMPGKPKFSAIINPDEMPLIHPLAVDWAYISPMTPILKRRPNRHHDHFTAGYWQFGPEVNLLTRMKHTSTRVLYYPNTTRVLFYPNTTKLVDP